MHAASHHIVPELASMAAALYRDGTIRGLIQALRPYICPYDVLIPLVRNGASILDVGCGAGLFLALLVRDGKQIRGIGVDLSPSAIALATQMRQKRLTPGEGEQIDFRVAPSEESWPDETFEVVSIIDIVHHVPPARQRDLLRAAAARVAPGGLLLYKDMRPRPLWRALMNRLHDLIVAREWIHYMPIAEVERTAQECGLRLIRSDAIDRIWYAHDLRLFERPISAGA